MVVGYFIDLCLYLYTNFFYHTQELFCTENVVWATVVAVPLLIVYRVIGPSSQGGGIRYRPELGYRDKAAGKELGTSRFQERKLNPVSESYKGGPIPEDAKKHL